MELNNNNNNIEQPFLPPSSKKNPLAPPSRCQHIKLLLLKNYLIFKRHPFMLMFFILGPLLVNSFILIAQELSDNVFSGTIKHPENYKIEHDIPQTIPKCQDDIFQRDKKNCISMGISIVGGKSEWTDYAIENLKKINNFSDQDLQIVHKSNFPIEPVDFDYFGKNLTFTQYLKNNPGKVQVGVQFCNGKIILPNAHAHNIDEKAYIADCQHMHLKSTFKQKEPYLPNNGTQFTNENQLSYKKVTQNLNYNDLKNSYYYTLFLDPLKTLYNPLNPNPYIPINNLDTTLKLQLDQLLISFEQQKTKNINANNTTNINIQYSSYPYQPNRASKRIIVATRQGAFYFFFAFLYLYIIFQSEIVKEKVYRLRQGLNIFGVKHLSYWSSWFITGLLFATFLTFFSILLGNLFQFKVFKDISIGYWILLFQPLGMGMLALAFFISTLVKTQKASNVVQYSFLLLSLVIGVFLASDRIVKYFFLDKNPFILEFVKFFLYLYPPFNYSALFQYYGRASDRNKPFGHEKFVHVEKGKLSGAGHYTKPSPLFFCMMLWLNMLIYLTLTYYFDNTLQSNRGRSKPWLFLFKKRYMCPKKLNNQPKQQSQLQFQQKRSISFNIQQQIQYNENTISTVIEQDQEQDSQIFSSEKFKSNLKEQTNQYQQEDQGIIIKNLTKQFQLGNMCKKRYKTALDNYSLTLNPNQTYAFLGHNGAGKTTLINILTGMLEYDKGSIFINGLDLEYEVEEIRKQIGICPQFDILWDELTAQEHIDLFCKIKGICNDKDIEKLVNTKLKQVSLTHVKHAYTESYSGGMKRRLSLVLSSIGDPKIIFLDEPTTGMDPQSRREVWELIKQIKKGKTIILTSHSMEEADLLSDQIVVMADGQLKCQGSSLSLKNQYGGGYRIDVVTTLQDQTPVNQAMKNLFPSSKLLDSAGGSLVFQIENSHKSDFKTFFTIMELDPKALSQQLTIIKLQQQQKQMQKEQQSHELEKQIQLLEDQLTLVEKIKDWGVQHATLEEVFITLTNKKEQSKALQQTIEQKQT